MTNRHLTAATLALTYVGSIVLAVYLVPFIVPVGFGLMAPAAVYVVGATLVLRDLVQRTAGPVVALGLMLVGVAVSATISPVFAFASAAAFGVSELIDLGVFSALHRWSLAGAVLISGAVSIVIDSVVFLTLAFDDLTFLPGQIVGKATMTVLGAVIVWTLARRSSILDDEPVTVTLDR